GDPEDESATPLQMFQPCRGGEVIGFRALRADLRERVDELPQMARAGSRQKLLLNAASIDEQSGLVSCLHDGLGELDRCARGLVELGNGKEKILVRDLIAKRFLLQRGVYACWRFPPHRRGPVDGAPGFSTKLEGGARQPPRVQDDPNLLAALGGEFASDQFAA